MQVSNYEVKTCIKLSVLNISRIKLIVASCYSTLVIWQRYSSDSDWFFSGLDFPYCSEADVRSKEFSPLALEKHAI